MKNPRIPFPGEKDLLWNTVQDFISKHKLHEDNVYDLDKWDCHSYPFIDDLCKIVGYYEYEENE